MKSHSKSQDLFKLSMQIPKTATPAEKRIIHAYIEIVSQKPLAGSALYREIARKLYYKVDKNNTNAFIRRVVHSFNVQ